MTSMEQIEIYTPHMCHTFIECDGCMACELQFEPCFCFSIEKQKTMRTLIHKLCEKAPNRIITRLEIEVNNKRRNMDIKIIQLELGLRLKSKSV